MSMFLQKIILKVFTCFLLLLCITSCEQAQESQRKTKAWQQSTGASLRVLTTTAQVASLVKQIGKEYVDVLELIQGESDPHSYQLVKGDDEKFSYADIVFYSGLGLEHGPSLVHQLRMSQAISVGDGIVKMNPSYAIELDGTVDPHIWMDISLWAKGVSVIANALADKAPEHAATFHLNASKVQQELLQLDTKVRALFQSIPDTGRYLVTTHDAFNYFTRRYLSTAEEIVNGDWTIRCRAPEGLAPDSQISTRNIHDITEYIIQYRVPCLFTEVGINQDSLRKLQEVLLEKGYPIKIVMDTLFSDSMGPSGSETGVYQGMIWHNVRTIYRYLGEDEKIENEAAS